MSLKLSAETVAEQDYWLKPMEFSLPAGLIGFPDARRVELIYNPEELRLRHRDRRRRRGAPRHPWRRRRPAF
jgi:hypothetical protein